MRAPETSRGSSLLIALIVTAALSLLALSLMLTRTQLRHGGGDPLRLRASLAARSALELFAARTGATGAGGLSMLRRAALPLPGEEIGRDQDPWEAGGRPALKEVLPGTRLLPPAFAGLRPEEGTDLSQRRQEAFVTEVYDVAATFEAGSGGLRKVQGVLRVSTAVLDVRRLPEPR